MMDGAEERQAEDNREKHTQDDPYKGSRVAFNLGVFLTRQLESSLDQFEVNQVLLGHSINLDSEAING